MKLKMSIDVDTSFELEGDFPIADVKSLAEQWFVALKEDGKFTEARIAAAVARFHKSSDALNETVEGVPRPSNP